MRPVKAKYRDLPTVWLDYKTGAGVTDEGHTVQPRISGRRKTPSVADLLDTAHAHQAARIMLCGKTPGQPKPGSSHWLITPTPGWIPATHWLREPPVGRFVLDARTPRPPRVEIHTCRAWFGTDDLTPHQARDAWRALSHVLDNVSRGRVKPLLSPARTAMDLWAASLPSDSTDPDALQVGNQTPEIAELIHATSGQHHIEHLAAETHSDCLPLITQPEIKHMAYLDGRFMYAAMCRDLAAHTATMMTTTEANDLWRENPYARARYRLKATVPDDWEHIGILGQQRDGGWCYPNKPGTRFETWADAAEVHLAATHGWGVHILDGISYGPRGRYLDTWADRLVRGRTAAATCHPDQLICDIVAAALRNILITGVGQFASRGRSTTRVVTDPSEIPATAAPTAVQHGQVWSYSTPAAAPTGANAVYYQPGLASQIWGRARARVLSGQTNGVATGVLSLPPSTVLGVQGDAIYTTVMPTWALPTDQGGADDGKPGRLRLKSFHCGPHKTPRTVAARTRIRNTRSVAVPLDAMWPPA